MESMRSQLREKYNDNTYNDPSNSFLGDGLLSTPQIDYYSKKYEIITGYDASCLKAAVYEMRLGDEAIRWNDGLALHFHMLQKPSESENLLSRLCSLIPAAKYTVPSDIATACLVLPPNSLTFVSIHEKLNLPRDIMARFNLKSVLVHRGLLLGGGPIIDPGYQSALVVPLHNFSNIPVQLYWRQPLLKVEFTRTMNPDMDNIGGMRLLKLDNARARVTEQELYSNTKYVESSVYAAIEKNDNLVKSLSSRLRTLSIASVIGLVALITAFYNLIINISNTANNATAKLHETQEKMAAFTVRNEKYLQGIDRQLGELIIELNHIRRTGNTETAPEVEKKARELQLQIGGSQK